MNNDERISWATAVLAAQLPEADDGGPQYVHPERAEAYAEQVLRELPPWRDWSRGPRIANEDLMILSHEVTKAGKFKKALEYLDLRTGEVIAASAIKVTSRKVGEHIEARTKIMRSLRAEVRRFAEFVLYFANRRKGITPGIDTLCRWYADLYGMRSQDVRRYIPRLKAAKVLIDDTLLGSAFQRSAGGLQSERGPDESMRQYKLFARLVPGEAERRDLLPPIPTAKGGATQPAWLAAEVARMAAQVEAVAS